MHDLSIINHLIINILLPKLIILEDLVNVKCILFNWVFKYIMIKLNECVQNVKQYYYSMQGIHYSTL